jgi:DNA repair exonuclease SbcCD ATPase subunit
MNYSDKLDQLYKEYYRKEAYSDAIKEDIETTEKVLEKIKQELLISKQVIEVLNKVSQDARIKAKNHLETIVTEALMYSKDTDNLKFEIELNEGSKPSCEFYITKLIDGIESKKKLETSYGGGYIDTVAIALRYAYVELFKDPIIKNSAIIMDEPGKATSENMSFKLAEFILSLGRNFDKQTIMITHNNNLKDIADKTIRVKLVNEKSYIEEE